MLPVLLAMFLSDTVRTAVNKVNGRVTVELDPVKMCSFIVIEKKDQAMYYIFSKTNIKIKFLLHFM